MKISEYEYAGVVYEFQPPVTVPDETTVENLGQLASHAHLAAASNLDPGIASAFAKSIEDVVNAKIARQPQANFVLASLRGALKDKHVVTIKG
jgi:hypothetical protein